MSDEIQFFLNPGSPDRFNQKLLQTTAKNHSWTKVITDVLVPSVTRLYKAVSERSTLAAAMA